MSCPYFMPERRCDSELWPQRARLPLGDGFAGYCCAQAEAYQPSSAELGEFCNIGYAAGCARLPAERDADAMRFMARAGEGVVSVQYLLERGHAPVSHGELRYDQARAAWSAPHPDARVQSKAQCYLDSYLARHPAAARTSTR
jgi:hypothetical protein